MRNATRITVSTFGAIGGFSGIVHGIGEVLQGNRTPEGIVFLSWPESAFFRILNGEPAMSIVPNLLITGILAVLFSFIFLVWVIMFVQRKYGALALAILSIVMLLVGAGFGPALLGIILSLAATRINAPLTWWRTRLSDGSRHLLGKLWPWSFSAAVTAWLLLFPGLSILSYFFGIDNLILVLIIILSAFGFLFLTIPTSFAYDSQR